MTITAYTGYRLFINGEPVQEEVGRWVDWKKPTTIDVQPYLQEGTNTIAIWGELFIGQHDNATAARENRAVAMTLRAQLADESERQVVTDGSWVGSSQNVDGWEETGFDDGPWQRARVKGEVGEEPWGAEFLENVSTATTPDRPLSINLDSPYLQVFEEGPDVVYDVMPSSASRVGWARFEVPPGTRALVLSTDAAVRAWIDGRQVPVQNDTVHVPEPSEDKATVALRMEMAQGEYGGAAIEEPIGLVLGGGEMPLGDWRKQGLPTYSGIGVYEQTIRLSEEEIRQNPVLDLGEVRVAAKVFVNGEAVGTRLAAPFKYDLKDTVTPGKNTITVHVANTLAPHYTIPDMSRNQLMQSLQYDDVGPTASGLLGPVSLFLYPEEKHTSE
jgi:hypothetical protein